MEVINQLYFLETSPVLKYLMFSEKLERQWRVNRIFEEREKYVCLSVLLYLIGVICFAAGWGSERVVLLCGTQSVPFVSADCTNGSGLYTAAFGIVLTFATAMLSGPADRATSSDKVALQLEQGENIVFLL
ncbi:PREDICTED: lipoma HMGIC fusion partner-like 2 protein [Diuraphis noxia]|uniref:lipoma HMGIC fusion partner-like 2 protein n=1 Tax=Diuraphis noxia TaxID=143948 RepID=UPI000763995A|nr:PREDICTED: lipoma HMGIC fusion partner-like 2 protein [Diuraphis noxia]